MHPPGNAKIYETHLATLWFDEHGILCALAKHNERTIETQKAAYAFISEISGNKKVCLLSDASNMTPPTRELREYMNQELPKYFKAMAMISETMLGKTMANTFMALKDPIPMQMFATEEEAREWLKQYL